jgi:hypothetical protein
MACDGNVVQVLRLREESAAFAETDEVRPSPYRMPCVLCGVCLMVRWPYEVRLALYRESFERFVGRCPIHVGHSVITSLCDHKSTTVRRC